MVEHVIVEGAKPLAAYDAVAHLAPAVLRLREEARRLVPRIAGRRVWMINSTARGGGVAEMLPTQITLLRDLGVDAGWLVIGSDRPEFFELTKRIHNLIHGVGTPALTPADRELYDDVSRANAAALRGLVEPGDILVVHDPQPLGAGALLSAELGLPSIWRCHIGLDQHVPQTTAAWKFLRPYAERYDHAVFSAPEYIPGYLTGRVSVVHPAIDPLSDKNTTLSLHKVVGILWNSGLGMHHGPLLTADYPSLAQRLQPDGSFAVARQPDDLALLSRPIVTQVSRWDRLKGFAPLMQAFRRLKLRARARPPRDRIHRRRLELVRLVLAGPDPSSIQDDPESQEVLRELCDAYLELEPEVQLDVALITLPMDSLRRNALMVNALQRASTIVVQNSLREGFGLTVTEAMWKRTAVLSNSRAVGPRHQIRDRIDGRLAEDPEDADGLADVLDEVLASPQDRARYGQTAQRRVHDEFLVLGQLRQWLEILAGVVDRLGSRGSD